MFVRAVALAGPAGRDVVRGPGHAGRQQDDIAEQSVRGAGFGALPHDQPDARHGQQHSGDPADGGSSLTQQNLGDQGDDGKGRNDHCGVGRGGEIDPDVLQAEVRGDTEQARVQHPHHGAARRGPPAALQADEHAQDKSGRGEPDRADRQGRKLAEQHFGDGEGGTPDQCRTKNGKDRTPGGPLRVHSVRHGASRTGRRRSFAFCALMRRPHSRRRPRSQWHATGRPR